MRRADNSTPSAFARRIARIRAARCLHRGPAAQPVEDAVAKRKRSDRRNGVVPRAREIKRRRTGTRGRDEGEEGWVCGGADRGGDAPSRAVSESAALRFDAHVERLLRLAEGGIRLAPPPRPPPPWDALPAEMVWEVLRPTDARTVGALAFSCKSMLALVAEASPRRFTEAAWWRWWLDPLARVWPRIDALAERADAPRRERTRRLDEAMQDCAERDLVGVATELLALGALPEDRDGEGRRGMRADEGRDRAGGDAAAMIGRASAGPLLRGAARACSPGILRLLVAEADREGRAGRQLFRRRHALHAMRALLLADPSSSAATGPERRECAVRAIGAMCDVLVPEQLRHVLQQRAAREHEGTARATDVPSEPPVPMVAAVLRWAAGAYFRGREDCDDDQDDRYRHSDGGSWAADAVLDAIAAWIDRLAPAGDRGREREQRYALVSWVMLECACTDCGPLVARCIERVVGVSLSHGAVLPKDGRPGGTGARMLLCLTRWAVRRRMSAPTLSALLRCSGFDADDLRRLYMEVARHGAAGTPWTSSASGTASGRADPAWAMREIEKRFRAVRADDKTSEHGTVAGKDEEEGLAMRAALRQAEAAGNDSAAAHVRRRLRRLRPTERVDYGIARMSARAHAGTSRCAVVRPG